MADRFVQSFASISNPEERLSALHKLVQTIGFSERQTACTLIHSKNDIVPQLPLELVLEVFSYLDVYDAWTLQLVNREWRRTVSSEQFLRATLARWESHDPSDSARSRDDVAGGSLRDKIRHMRAIRHGKPFTVTTYDNTGTGWGGPFQQLFYRGIDLKGDKIAYISRQSGESDTVVVRNLVTGAASMLHGEAREKIKSIVLTSNVVAFVTFEGALYVTKLSDHLLLQKTTRIQLPSSNVQAIAGHDNTLALVLRRGGRGSVFKACVLVYDAETRRLQDYNIDKQPEGKDKMVNAVGIIVDSGRETINIFMLASEPAPLSTGADPAGDDLILTHLRMSLTGVVLSRQGRAWHHNIAREYLKLGVRFGMPPPQLSGCKDEYRIQIAQLPAGVNRSHQPVRLTLDLAFNVKTGSWTVRDQVRRCCRVSEVNRSVSEEDTYDKVLQAEWKGVTMSPGLARHSDLVHSVAMMNDSFLVSMSVESTEQVSGMTSIEVFCFDENVKMYAAQDLGLWPWLDDSRRL